MVQKKSVLDKLKMSVLVFLGVYLPLGLIVAVIGIKVYFKAVAGVCKSKKRVDGQVAIVTGSNSGTVYVIYLVGISGPLDEI